MAETTPFGLQSPNGEKWNLDIDNNGRLAFNANGTAGGVKRMSIEDDGGVTVEGNVQAADLYATDESGGISIRLEGNTGKIQAASVEAKGIKVENALGFTTTTIGSTGSLFLGANPINGPTNFFPGEDGDLFVRDGNGGTSITLSGSSGNIEATSITLSAGNDIDEPAKVQLANDDGLTTVDLHGSTGNITLGAYPSGSTPGKDGNLYVRDGIGEISIALSGLTGDVAARSFTIISPPPPLLMEITSGEKNGSTPIPDALNKVLGLRAVRYHWKQEDSLQQGSSKDSHIGFIGQEVEMVCPEVVSTNSEGYKSLHYSHLTAVLVEAMKEQQSLIKQQAAALSEALGKIERLEVTMQQLQA